MASYNLVLPFYPFEENHTMCRTAAALTITMILTRLPTVWAQPTPVAPPLTYEVQINGESFLVEANRLVKLESKEKPGVTYHVAVRVAPTQRVRLNTLQFDYELPAKVVDDRKRENRSVRLTHELGFSILLTDLGQPLQPETQEATLKALVGSVVEELRAEKATGVDVSEPHQRRFGGSSARGATIRYHDARDLGHVCLLYVLTGSTFSASCVVEYLDHDSDDVLPLIKRTLDSVRPIPRGGSTAPK